MKFKDTKLIKVFILFCCYSTIALTQVTVFPYSVNFDAGTDGWTNVGGDDFDWSQTTGGTPSGGTGPTGASNGAGYLFTEASNPNNPNKRAFLEQTFDFAGQLHPQLKFDYHLFGTGIGGLYIDVYDGSWNNSVFSLVGQQQTASADAWREAIVDLSAYANRSDIIIRFRGLVGPNFESDISIDNVNVCTILPGEAVVSSAALCTAGTVSLSLSGQDAVGTIQWQQSTDNVVFSNLAGATSTTANHTTAALATGNTYYFRAAVTNGCTNYSNVVTVTVEASSGAASSFPEFEDFEVGTGIWSNVAGDDFDWIRDQAGTPSVGTGPAEGHDGSDFYIYTEASVPNSPTKIAFLEATFDFTGIADPEIEFYYHMFGTNSGTLFLDVGAQDGFWSISGAQQTSSLDLYKKAVVNLSAFGNQCNVRIRFRAITGVDWSSDIAIDDITVRDACLSVNGGAASISETTKCSAGTVDLSLVGQNGGGTIQWQQSTDNVIFVDLAGATAPNYTTGVLSTGSTYYYRAAVTNGCTNYSDTVSVIVSTGTGVSVFPYSEGFESGVGVWGGAAGDDFDWARTSGGTASGGTGPSGANAGSFYFYTEASAPNFPAKDAFLQADFDFTNVSKPILSFYYHLFGADIGTLSVEANGTNVWSITGQQQTANGDAWIQEFVDLSPFAGECNVTIRFKAKTGSNFASDFAIDDIAICTVNPGKATNSSNSFCADSPVDLSLDDYDGGTTIQWEQSTDNVTFSAIGGATTVDFTTATLTTGATYYHRAAVTDGCTNYSDTVSVNISAGGGITAFPYSESFETGLGAWNNAAVGDDFDWTRLSGPTGSGSTGPAGAGDGNFYVYTEASAPNFPSRNAFLEAEFDFTGVTDPQVTFSYHMFGIATGTLYLDVNGVTVWSKTGGQQNGISDPWKTATVDLSAYSDACSAILRFRGVTGSDFTGDMAVDDINVCIKPATSEIAGNTDLCKSAAGESYSVTNSAGNTYTWILDGGVKTGGGTTNSITVDWGAIGKESSIKVIEQSGECKGDTVSKTVVIHTLETSPISGNEKVAENKTGETYAVTANPGYTYAWVVTGGTITSGQGTNEITVTWGAGGAGNVSVVATSGAPSPACASAPAVNLAVTIFSLIESVADGDWDDAATWDCICIPDPTNNATIISPHQVTLVADHTIDNLIIASGGTLNQGANLMTVTGDYTNNGTHLGTGVIRLSGTDTRISGVGTITNGADLELTNGNKTIEAGTVLTKTAGDVNIASAGIVVRNYGDITVSGDLIGVNGSVEWINEANSNLTVGGTLLSSGLLSSSATGNTVEYNGVGAQNIKLPDGSSYYNLNISNSSSALLTGNIIANDLTISGTAQLDVSGSNYNLNLSGNWTNSSASGDPFVERSGSVSLIGAGTNQVITNTNVEYFHNLTVNKSAGGVVLAASSDISVANSLTLTKGIISPSGNEIVRIPSGGIATSTSDSYVAGTVRKEGNTAFVFPIGNNGRYARIGISAPTTASTFDANYSESSFSNVSDLGTLTNVSSTEYWNLDRTAGTGDCRVTLYWEDAEYSGITDISGGDLVVAHWNSTTTEWEDVGGTYTGIVSKGTVTSNVLSSFSPFAFGSKAPAVNPLPVELLSFTALKGNKEVILNWTTAVEINNDFFVVQRSVDGINFEDVATVPGAGNSIRILNYSYIDYFELTDNLYYRLEQTDFDGKVTYTPIQVVSENNKSSEGLYNIFPNPTYNGQVNLQMEADNYDEVLVILYNSLGQEIFSKIVIQQVGNTTLALNLSGKLNPGIYIIVGTSKNELFRKRLVVH